MTGGSRTIGSSSHRARQAPAGGLRGSLRPLRLRGLRHAGRFRLRLPDVITARVEVECQPLVVQLGVHFVLDLGVGDQYATEVAGDATTLPAPEANGCSTAQGRHGKTLGARRLRIIVTVSRSGPVHWFTLQSPDLQLAAWNGFTMRRPE